MLSNKLRERVESTSASMGFYLLRKEVEDKKNYENGLVDLIKNIAALRKMPIIQVDQKSMAMLSTLELELVDFAK